MDLFLKPASGAGEERLLLRSDAGKFATSWSRNGEFILFDNWQQQSKGAIWMLPLANPDDAKPVLQSTAFNQLQGQLSPDRHFVAYTSDESGRVEVYVQRYPPSSEKWQISSSSGLQPLWRADGKELFFITEEQKFMAVEIKPGSSFETGIPHELFQGAMTITAGYSYAVSSDGQKFLVSSTIEGGEVSPMTIVLNWSAKLTVK